MTLVPEQGAPLILVADDDDATRALLRIELEGEGYAVVEAVDGLDAVDVAERHDLALAILDISMPGIDGYGVLQQLQAGRGAPGGAAPTPVLLLSGHGGQSEAARALANGAHDFVRKPYDAAELLARVDAALRIKSIQSEMQRRSADLEHLNRTDPLTGLYNRRWLVDQLRSVATAALRSGRAYAVLMVDIDHFKAVNDGWGHEAGDRILCIVAERMQRSLRGPDVAGRWGGEEFLILLPETELREALIVGERIRRALGDPLDGAELALPPAVSASIGCASGRGLDFSDVVRRADSALYRAKAGGRDRVESTGTVGRPADAAPSTPAAQPALPSGMDPARRADAVMALLAGVSEESVAVDHGVEVEMVRRWRQMFIEGGRERLAGRPPPGSTEMRDRYLAVLAHELLIPLTVLKGWASLMASGRLSAEQAAEVPGIILEAAGRMEHTSRDILDSAAVAVGRLRLSIEALDLRQLVEEAVAGVADPHVVVRPQAPVATPVVADRVRVLQVLTNLLTTARLHGGQGPMEVELGGDGNEATLQVTTRSQVLEFEVAKQLFEPWASDTVVTGTGVGLYVCRALIVAHGGLMGVQGDGAVTTFWIRLPAGGPPVGELVERITTP